MESPSTPPSLPNAPAEAEPPPFWLGGLLLALLTIAGCSVWVVMGNEKEKEEKRTRPEAANVTPNPVMEIMARYAYGLKMQLQALGQWNEKLETQLQGELQTLSKNPVDRFRGAIVKAAIKGGAADESEVASAVKEMPALERDQRVLQQIQEQGRAVPAEDWQWFQQRHGWIARLARAPALPESDPERKSLAADGTKTMIIWALAFFGGALAFLGGIAILAWLFIWVVRGKLQTAVNRPTTPWAGVLLEGFAIYLCGWTVIPEILTQVAPSMSHWVTLGIAALVVPVAVLWPRWRGMQRQTWKNAVGWHRGGGFAKEMACGLLGWLAAIPFIVVALFIAQWMASRTQTEFGHPIIEPLTRSGWAQTVAVLMAVVWAPLAEEVTFRGLLFPGLSALMRWLLGAVVGAFIFAVIHPQGWLAVPAIMSIALAASALRLLRGSLIAPMTLHAINNGLLVLLLILSAG